MEAERLPAFSAVQFSDGQVRRHAHLTKEGVVAKTANLAMTPSNKLFREVGKDGTVDSYIPTKRLRGNESLGYRG